MESRDAGAWPRRRAKPIGLPRTASGQPDLNGFWQALNTAHWDLEAHEAAPGPVLQLGAAYAVPPGPGVVMDGPIPYRPDALAMKKKYAADALREDAEVKCYLPGVPRMMYMPYPVQIVQSDSTIMMMSEFASALRTIYMNSTTRPPADTWMGWSNGKWDGDTLVIDSNGFMGGTVGALDQEGTIHVRFLDRAGNYHTDGLHVVERIRRTDADHLFVPGDHRGSECLHAAVDDQHAAVSPGRAEHAARRVQVRRVRRRSRLRQGPEEMKMRNALVAASSPARVRVCGAQTGRSHPRRRTYKVPRTPDGQPDSSGLLDEPDLYAVRAAEGAGEEAVLHGEGSDRRVQQGGRRFAESGRPLREHRFRRRRRCRRARSRTCARRW